jgi:DNA-binding response OmpR family regulator
MRLLVIEDDLELASALGAAFARRDVASDHAATAGDAMLMLDATRYAAVLIDLGLSDGEGLQVLRRLRERHDPVPVLILSARSDLRDRIEGLEAGADDYLIKPFDFEELFARLRAVLRRNGNFQGNAMVLGNLRFDTLSREVDVGGSVVVLSQRETELIDLLMRRSGRVVTKRLAEDQLFGMSETLGSNAVEVYVHRLRRKLDLSGAEVRIETVRGVGYLLRATG